MWGWDSIHQCLGTWSWPLYGPGVSNNSGGVPALGSVSPIQAGVSWGQFGWYSNATHLYSAETQSGVVESRKPSGSWECFSSLHIMPTGSSLAEAEAMEWGAFAAWRGCELELSSTPILHCTGGHPPPPSPQLSTPGAFSQFVPNSHPTFSSDTVFIFFCFFFFLLIFEYGCTCVHTRTSVHTCMCVWCTCQDQRTVFGSWSSFCHRGPSHWPPFPRLVARAFAHRATVLV